MTESDPNAKANRIALLGWRAFFAVLIAAGIGLVVFVAIPAMQSPNSRFYAGRFGYASLQRWLDRPIPVEVETVTTREMTKAISANGAVAYLNEIPIKSETPGIVTEILVKPGHAV